MVVTVRFGVARQLVATATGVQCPVMNEQERQGPRHRWLPRALLIHNGRQLIDRHGGGQPGRQLRALATDIFEMFEAVSAAGRWHGSSDVSFLTEVGIALHGRSRDVFQTSETSLQVAVVERVDRRPDPVTLEGRGEIRELRIGGVRVVNDGDKPDVGRHDNRDGAGRSEH